ncbi:c-type cytochrome [Roseiconus nitratireducens]|uniref:C-type cytochrome n=1 Tax=Roseiconus nitratireducens TaxID=2605748 RepID=A0A5M6CXP8_9BACT|nr:c-type cytochrome [Roseiconus nitratireducens]KAA5539190.1 c-type cytochrome [Roseiconus nitratireducens]
MHKHTELILLTLFLGWTLPSQPAWAQLSDQLNSESVEQLARDARQQGDPIRGAILYPQESLGCVKCHGPGDNRIGPDLTAMSKDRSDEHLVEAVLNPSKLISQGYEATQILTQDGKVFSGRLLSATDQQVILRENSDDQRRRSFDRDQIDQMVTAPKSLMPDKLADQLKNRQQFLDLIGYLMQLRDSAESPTEAGDAKRKDLTPELRGLVLIDRYQCGNCHDNDLVSNQTPADAAPRLSRLSPILDPSHLRRFISDPAREKPGTRMPNLLAGKSTPEQDQIALQITHFLVSKFQRPVTESDVDEAAAERGKRLFHSVGCVACHAPRDSDEQPLLTESSVSLGPLQYSLAGLVEFLEDPLAFRPSGRMPDLKLTHWEAVDLAHYLLSWRGRRPTFDFQPDPQLATSGEQQFQRFNCVACHQEVSPRESSVAKSDTPPLSALRPNRGCLSNSPGPWPTYTLHPSEVDAIRRAMDRFGGGQNLPTETQIQISLEAFRCTACHQRDALGGVPDERADYFQTANPNLGPQGRFPPTLTGVGGKLRRKWMREILVHGRSVRPYVQTRMPRYGTENAEHLVELFQSNDRGPADERTQADDPEQQKALRDAGFQLVSHDGLNCIACHTFQLKPGMTMSALDLTVMHERLKPDWFDRFLRDPKQQNPGTVMPSFWPSGRSVRPAILDGDADRQIAAIWEWMKDGRQARTPRGLVVEPMELLATDEAVMLRRKYPGIGKRGIGVGYPRQINVAFDAEQMRLASMWRGKFVDPAGVFRSQGHGTVRPLGDDRYNFHPGPEIDDAGNPWIADDGRPPKHRFRGYTLDRKRRPTFQYAFEDVLIEDQCVDDVAANSSVPIFRRTITLRSDSGRDGMIFRIAPEQPVDQLGKGNYRIGNSLQVQLLPPHTGSIVMEESRQTIRVPIDLKASRPERIVLEYAWLP